MTIKIQFFYDSKGREMLTNKSHVISCLLKRYNHKISRKGKHIVFLTSNSLKMYFTNLHDVLFLRVWRFSTADKIRSPFHAVKWFLWIPFFVWYSLNELINISLYFFTSFPNLDWLCFSILWTFGNELAKLII